MDSEVQQGVGYDLLKPKHPKTERFYQLLQQIGALHDRKGKDYGRQDDPFSNIVASQDFGIRPVVGALLRMNDKVRRLQVWAQTGQLANESAQDSMLDIAVYALIAYIETEVEQRG